jgi:hypothetical protein
MSLEIIFTNTLLPESTIRAQILAAIQFYASQSDIIYKTIPSGYSHKNINAAAIEDTLTTTQSCQSTTNEPTTITSTLSTPVTYTASLPSVLALTTTSSDQIDPNVAFSNLTSLVNLR